MVKNTAALRGRQTLNVLFHSETPLNFPTKNANTHYADEHQFGREVVDLKHYPVQQQRKFTQTHCLGCREEVVSKSRLMEGNIFRRRFIDLHQQKLQR